MQSVMGIWRIKRITSVGGKSKIGKDSMKLNKEAYNLWKRK